MRESLVLTREQTRRGGYASILDIVIDNVSNGQNLSTSLAKFKNIFGDFTINIIAWGEQSGILSENLEYIALELEKRQALRRKIISAAIYPIIITIATLGITIFLIEFLFPKIMPIFRSINIDLPLSTLILIAINGFASHFGLISIISLITVVALFLFTLKKSLIAHLYFDKFLLKLPIAGKIIKDYNMANFTRAFGLLLKSGVNINDAISISAKTTINFVYKKEFEMLANRADQGEKISIHLMKRRKLFPDIVSQIISVGELSGSLPNSLIYLSSMYEEELDDFTKNLTSMVEPILMIIMGLLVGFIAISIITPIYNITQHLSPR